MLHERATGVESRAACRAVRRALSTGTTVTRHVPVGDANTKLTALVRGAERETLVLTRHSHPAAVMISARRYQALLAQIEILDDHLSLHEREALTVGLDRLEP